MSVWKRHKKKRVNQGEKNYNKATWIAEGTFRGVRYKESIPLALTKKDAEDHELKIKQDILSGDYELNKKKTTYADYVKKIYLPRIKKKNASWELNKKYQIERLLKFFGKYQIKSISRVLCEKYQTQRMNETVPCQKCEKFKPYCYLCSGANPRYKAPCWKCRKRIVKMEIHKAVCQPEKVKPSTVNRDLATHSDILSDAVIDGELKSNPMLHVEKLSEPAPSERILNADEKIRIFDLLKGDNLTPARERLRAIIFIALTTGWREGRIMQIKKEDLNYQTQSVVVQKSKQDEAKTVRVSSFTWEILAGLAENVSSGALFRNLSDGTPLKRFPNEDWWQLLKDAKIENLTFHNLRATVGTEMVLGGASAFEVQNALGHKRITTTQRYVRIADKILTDNLEKQSEKYREFAK